VTRAAAKLQPVLQKSNRARCWSATDIAWLKAHYADTSNPDLARQLGRTVPGILQQALKLCLRKSPEFAATQCQRFASGQTPWNRGKAYQAGGRSAETRFKPGVVSGRAAAHEQPVGAERWIDGHLWRKVSMTGPMRQRWRPIHHLLWEAAGHSIPPGRVLAFRNRNPNDLRLENLELVTRAEMMHRNSRHRLPDEVKELVNLRGALTRRLNNVEAKRRRAA
jgi:hypothetical protein